jgi:Ca-activated chloride channel family protein
VSFEAPHLLVWLLVIPVAVGLYALLESRRDRRAAAWATPALLPNMVSRAPAWRRSLPFALLLFGLALLLIGFARPTVTHTVKRQQATVVVVLDVSGSMAAGDLQPSRLAAAKATAYRLVNALPHGYRASVVIFSDHSAVIAPPTDDLNSVRAAIARAHTGPQGTALGEAVYHAVDVARRVPAQSNGKRPPASVVVLSDGGLTAGRVTPQQAAKRAAGSRVPIFAVAFGTPQGIVRQQLQGGFEEQIQVPVSDTVLQQFAHWTGGRLWTSPAEFDPRVVYRNLDARTGTQRKTVEVTAVAAGGGIAFMLAGAGLSGLWFRRLT